MGRMKSAALGFALAVASLGPAAAQVAPEVFGALPDVQEAQVPPTGAIWRRLKTSRRARRSSSTISTTRRSGRSASKPVR